MHNDRHCHWTHRKMCDQITHDTLLQYGRDMDSKLQNNDSPSLNRPSTSSPPATQANFLVRKGHALSSAPRQEVEPKEQILQAERLVPRLSVNNRAKPLETDRQSSSNYDDELEQTYSPQTSDKGVFPVQKPVVPSFNTTQNRKRKADEDVADAESEKLQFKAVKVDAGCSPVDLRGYYTGNRGFHRVLG